jgi:hypothetical protein
MAAQAAEDGSLTTSNSGVSNEIFGDRTPMVETQNRQGSDAFQPNSGWFGRDFGQFNTEFLGFNAVNPLDS